MWDTFFVIALYMRFLCILCNEQTLELFTLFDCTHHFVVFILGCRHKKVTNNQR